MIDAKEHLYADDPKIGHPDVRTELPGVNYFFLGNGFISAAVQHAPQGIGTCYGLIFMDPDQLKAKRDSLSFDKKTGFAKTQLYLYFEDTEPITHHNLTVQWDDLHSLPCVKIQWHAPELVITEKCFCADRSQAALYREIKIQNATDQSRKVNLATGLCDNKLEQAFTLPARQATILCIRYDLDKNAQVITLRWLASPPDRTEAADYWQKINLVKSQPPLMEHWYNTAAVQLSSVLSNQAKIDASIWQYNREWVRDHSYMAYGLMLSGNHEASRTMLQRLLCEFTAENGATSDSSEIRADAEVELDQNGILLIVLKEYVCWTGDWSLITTNWDRIVKIAEYPLSPQFRESKSGLFMNQREYWERHRIHGIQPGLELIYQVMVSLGLAAAADLAGRLNKKTLAEHWQREASRLQETVLHHPTHAFVTEKGFVKRKNLDGAVQQTIIPLAEAGLPIEVGLARQGPRPLDPDTCAVLPIVFGFVPAQSAAALATLEHMEILWNQEWETGGYGRYNAESDADSPGAWPFASLFVARAYLEAENYEKTERILNWFSTLKEFNSGAYFELYGNRIAPPYAQNGIIPWCWAEIIQFTIINMFGFHAELNAIRIKPRLLPHLLGIKGSVRFRGHHIHYDFAFDPAINETQCTVNSQPMPFTDSGVRIPVCDRDVLVVVRLPMHRKN